MRSCKSVTPTGRTIPTILGFHTLQNNRSVVPEGPRNPRESRADSGEAGATIGAFSGSLAPLPAPRQDALHPHAVNAQRR